MEGTVDHYQVDLARLPIDHHAEKGLRLHQSQVAWSAWDKGQLVQWAAKMCSWACLQYIVFGDQV